MDTPQLLATGEIEVEGRLVDASNLALRVWVQADGQRIPAVYKPIRGERELWDFPDGTLAGREVATFLIAEAGGWTQIPETVLRDGPLGPGSVQRWVGPLDPADPIGLIRLDRVSAIPDGYLPVVGLEMDVEGQMVLSHADDPRLASLAVLDAALNNTDRKGSHLIEDGDHLWAIDHGVTCHAEPKLRTVLWGWAGDPIPEADLQRLQRLWYALQEDGGTREGGVGATLGAALSLLLTPLEVAALGERVEALLASGQFPEPGRGRTPLPWPPW